MTLCSPASPACFSRASRSWESVTSSTMSFSFSGGGICLEDLHGFLRGGLVYHYPLERPYDQARILVLEDVATIGDPDRARLHHVAGHLQQLQVGVHLCPSGEDHGDGTLPDHFMERLRAARIDSLHDVGPRLGPYPGNV